MRPRRARPWFVAVVLFGSPACGITDASDASRVDGTVVNIFSETPLGDVGVYLVEYGELVGPDRTIASTRTAADGTFSIAYDSEGVRCSSLLLRVVRDGYFLAANPDLDSARIEGCETRAHRAGMAPRPVHVALSPAQLTVPFGQRATFSVAVHYIDGSILTAKRSVAGATYGLVSLRPDPTWESLEECGIAAHHNGEEGIYDAPLGPPPESCGAETGAVWVWADHADGTTIGEPPLEDGTWRATSDSVFVRVLSS